MSIWSIIIGTLFVGPKICVCVCLYKFPSCFVFLYFVNCKMGPKQMGPTQMDPNKQMGPT